MADEQPRRRGASVTGRRIFPLLSTASLIVIGMISTIWVAPHLIGRFAWSLPHDLWGTMVAADRLLHGQFSRLYTRPTGLITLPGGALILTPLVALIDGLLLSSPAHPRPAPSASRDLAAGRPLRDGHLRRSPLRGRRDRRAPRLSMLRRALLAAAGAVLLWNVSIRWGHPEDAVAVGLLLYATLDLAKGQIDPAGPPGFSARRGDPAARAARTAGLLAVLTEADRRLSHPGRPARRGPAGPRGGRELARHLHAVTRQPNWPSIDHPTPWLAPGHAPAGRRGRGRPVPAPRDRGRLRLRGRLAPVPGRPRPDLSGLGRTIAAPGAVVDRGRAGRAVGVRAGDGRLLRLAVAHDGPDRLGCELVGPAHDHSAPGSDHLRLAVLLAGPWTWWAPLFIGLCLTLFLARVRRQPEPPASAGSWSRRRDDRRQSRPPCEPVMTAGCFGTPNTRQFAFTLTG